MSNESYKYAYELAANYHEKTKDGYYTDWRKIPDEDKEAFAGLLIDRDDRDLFSIYENKNYDDIVCSLLSMLSKGTRDAEEDFTLCLKKNLVSYYEDQMIELLDEATVDLETEEYESHGIVRMQHKDNGESYWGART